MTLTERLFLQTDPILSDASDANIYRYCGNDPINNVDGAGTSWSSFGYNVAMGAAVAGLVTAAVILAAPVVAAAAAGAGTAALVAAGVEAATAATVVDAGITATAGAAAIAGTGLAAGNAIHDVANAEQTGNWDQVGYDTGAFAGGLASGLGYAGYTGTLGEMGTYDSDYNGLVSSNQITQLENDLNWFATMPSDQSGALAAGAASDLITPAVSPDGCSGQ